MVRKAALKRPSSALAGPVPARKAPGKRAAAVASRKRPASAAASPVVAFVRRPTEELTTDDQNSEAEPGPDTSAAGRVLSGKHDPRGHSKWNDTTLHAWTCVEIPDAELRAHMRMHLCHRSHNHGCGRSHGVVWSTLSTLPADAGFAVQMAQPVRFRTAHLWWRHRFMMITDAPVGELYEMRGLPGPPAGSVALHDHEGTTQLRAPNRPPCPDDLASPPTTQPTQEPRGASASTPASSSTAVKVLWPQYPARRLAGAWCSETGVGGTPAAYSMGTRIGKGTYGVVHKVTFGGHVLAVKAFAAENNAFAWQEASIAEHLRGHPHVVHLLDACLRPRDGASLLVYRFAGVSLLEALDLVAVSPASAQSIAVQVARGVAHLHTHSLWHSDLKPANIVVDGLEAPAARPRAVVADLGGVVEVAPEGSMTFDGASRTTLWYRAPELLTSRPVQAFGRTWLKADVWAWGLIVCEMAGQTFHQVDWTHQSPKQQNFSMFVALAQVFPGCDNQVYPPESVTLPPALREVHGPACVDCLELALAWEVEERLDMDSCLQQTWLSTDRLSYRHDRAALLPGDRHPWAIISGVMSIDVLQWLQPDVFEVDALRRRSHSTDLQDGLKTVLSGKLVEQPGSQTLNGLDIKEYLPCARVLAWVRAWKACNAGSLAQMMLNATHAVRLLGKSTSLGLNANHFLECKPFSFCLVAGQVHIFKEPGEVQENMHHDGGASVLHMGITLFGRRRLRCWEDDSDGEYQDFPQVPGSVYLGTLTGPLHQVRHDLPRADCEVHRGHSVSIMLRTTLFPHSRARAMKHVAEPQFLGCLSRAFAESLRDLPWSLPDLAQCLAHAPVAQQA